MLTYQTAKLIADGSTIHIFAKDESRIMEEHTHDFIEIVYVRSGSATEYVNTEAFAVTRGDLIFINYGSTHRFEPGDGFSYVNICFNPETIGRTLITPENAFAMLQLTAFDEIRRDSDAGVVSFSASEREEIEALLTTMLREYSGHAEGWRTVLESSMNILMVRILRKISGGANVGGTQRDDAMWRALCDYIDTNLGEGELTLPALAGKCFYNPSYFSRVFKERFGMTLSEYINRRKVEQAAHLAADNSLSVEEIAARVGFSSKSSLYRAFARVKGVSFADFRREK